MAQIHGGDFHKENMAIRTHQVMNVHASQGPGEKKRKGREDEVGIQMIMINSGCHEKGANRVGVTNIQWVLLEV